MKRFKSSVLKIFGMMALSCVVMILYSSVAFADNPIVQTSLTADPAPMVYDGRLYVYTTQDEPEVPNMAGMNDWKCYSTTDMVNWTDHGTILTREDLKWAKSRAWATQCVEKDGKFYLYVSVGTTEGGNLTLGVAVADSPTGPFRDAIGKGLLEGAGYRDGWFPDIDPTVFIDDDGEAYLYWGNAMVGGGLYYAKLNEDMISLDQEVGVVAVDLNEETFGYGPNRVSSFDEAPWLYKRNGLYYMVFASDIVYQKQRVAYSTSPSPTGPWTFRGVIMSEQGDTSTNHPGVIDYKGHSYLFYHNGSLPGGHSQKRSVCVEEIEYNEDGTIKPVDMTKDGPKAVDTLNPYVRNEAETISWTANISWPSGDYHDSNDSAPQDVRIKTEPDNQGGIHICNVLDGNYIKVKNVDFGEMSPDFFTASVSCEGLGGSIELRLDSCDGPLIGTLDVYDTGGWDVWEEVTTEDILSAEGIHDLYFVYKAAAEQDTELFKVDYWKFGIRARELTVDPKSLDLYPGASEKLTAAVAPANVTNKDVFWSSNQPSVAEVSQDGTVTATGVGTATITAKAQDGSGVSARCQVRVSIPVTNVSISPKTLKLTPGDQQTLQVTVSPSNATNKNIVWTSDQTSVATVSASGTVTAKGIGTARIRAEAEDGRVLGDTCVVTVTDKSPYRITYQLYGGKNSKANPLVYPVNESVVLKNPTRKKYIFEGWYADKNFRTKVTKVSGKDITLYAKWVRVSVPKAKIKSLKNKSSKRVNLVIQKIKKPGIRYQILYAQDKKFKKGKKTVVVNKTTATLKRLKKGATYYVKVRAFQKDSTGKKYYGKYGKFKKVKINK